MNRQHTHAADGLTPTSPERKLRDAIVASSRSRVAPHVPELPLGAHATSHITHRTSDMGFTLIELLLSMFILAIGMVAIASIFPVAGYLQKSAYADVLTLQVKRHATASIEAVDVPDSAMPSGTGVKAFSSAALDNYFPLAMRCYPQALDLDGDGIPNEASTDEADFGQRNFYWVPLVRNFGTTNAPDYRYYVFILERKSSVIYSGSGGANGNDPNTVPKVLNTSANGSSGGDTLSGVATATGIEAGDQLLADTGQILQVSEVTGTTVKIAGTIQDTISSVWYGTAPAGDVTATRRIIVLGGEATE